MAKVNSRFHAVIKVKKHQEKTTQQKLTKIEDNHTKEKDTLNRLHEKKEKAVGSAPRFGRALVTDLQAQQAFIFKLSRQISHQSSKVEEIKGQADATRQELTSRVQSRQMVEKLDEKYEDEKAKIIDRKEQEILDDVAKRPGKTVE